MNVDMGMKTVLYMDIGTLSEHVNRSPDTINRMISQNDLPDPDAAIKRPGTTARSGTERRALWSHRLIDDWFSTCNHAQAIVVPGSDLARFELDEFGVYACPALPPSFVGLARPVLAGIRIAGVVTVYPVRATFTDAAPGPQPTGRQLRDILQKINESRGDSEPKTVFELETRESLGQFTWSAPLRQGRVVGPNSLREALKHGQIVEMTRSESFH